MRRGAALVVASALAACGVAITPQTPGVFLDVPQDGVDFGVAFPVTVSRGWREGEPAPAWDESRLAPLEVRAKETSQRTDAGRVSETRLFDGYLFRAGDVEVPAAKATVHVNHAVDPKKPGDPELPGEPLAVPLPVWAKTAGAAAVLGLLVFFVRQVRRRPAPPPPPPPSEAPAAPRPDAVALAALAKLRSAACVHVETAAIVREFVRARFASEALERTTEELAADARVGEHGPQLLAVLGACDLVKFACAEPTAADSGRLLDDAETFVRSAGDGT